MVLAIGQGQRRGGELLRAFAGTSTSAGIAIRSAARTTGATGTSTAHLACTGQDFFIGGRWLGIGAGMQGELGWIKDQHSLTLQLAVPLGKVFL